MKNIIIIGAGPHASCIIDIVEKENKFNIIGLTHPSLEIGSSFLGYKIIGRQEDINELTKKYMIDGGIIAIGDNWTRKIVCDIITNICPDFNFITTLHPSVSIARDVKIGKGSVIMPGVHINIGATVGDFCIINTNSSLEHYCIMEDYSSLSAGVVTGGYFTLGKYSAIALGVTIFDRVLVGEHTVIGSGALVTKNIPDNVVAYGIPVKIIRQREIGEKYL